MEWKRQDQMTIKERQEMKKEFIESLLNDEIHKWKYVEFEGHQTEYMISDDGRLVSLRMCRLMHPAKGSDGYLATVIRVNGEKRNVAIHRLVALAFIPNPEHKEQVNHINGDKNNNSVSNLEWVTHEENIEHAIETGLRDRYLPKKLSKKTIHKICKMLEKGKPPSEISKKVGVSRSIVRSIKRGKSWKHISKLYEIPRLILNDRSYQSIAKEQSSTTTESLHEYEEEFYYSWELVR